MDNRFEEWLLDAAKNDALDLEDWVTRKISAVEELCELGVDCGEALDRLAKFAADHLSQTFPCYVNVYRVVREGSDIPTDTWTPVMGSKVESKEELDKTKDYAAKRWLSRNDDQATILLLNSSGEYRMRIEDSFGCSFKEVANDCRR